MVELFCECQLHRRTYMHLGGAPNGAEPLQRRVHHGIPWRPLETKKTSVDTGVRPFDPSCSGGGGGEGEGRGGVCVWEGGGGVVVVVVLTVCINDVSVETAKQSCT